MAIQKLPEHVINLIAAGEVVERPLSVVRELVDNSVDAGARTITVSIDEGGTRRIEVIDDGNGIPADEILVALERHATSKISGAHELFAIPTRGFRGEALAATASVSILTIASRYVVAETGVEVRSEFGKQGCRESRAMPVGTTVRVEQLFGRTPARKKFLKSVRTESLAIKRWLQQQALAKPSLGLTLIVDGEEVLRFPAGESSDTRARRFFRAGFLSLEHQENGVTVRGCIGLPSLVDSELPLLVAIVNGRVVHDRMMQRALRDGLSIQLKSSEAPIGVVEVSLPLSAVDVNVHPQKSEVRFENPSAVYLALRHSCARSPMSATAFSKPPSSKVPGTFVEAGEWFHAPQKPELMGTVQLGGVSDSSRFLNRDETSRQLSVVATEIEDGEVRYLGQLFKCFLLFQAPEYVELIDMHAAHERLNFDRVMSLSSSPGREVQNLLIPLVFRFSEEGLLALEEARLELEQLGLKIECSSQDCSVKVLSCPSFIPLNSIHPLLTEIVTTPGEARDAPLERRRDRFAATIACHASIRSGDTLSDSEAYALRRRILQIGVSAVCPHGRPLRVVLNQNQIGAWFGRSA